jgi:hypothetical protein
VFAVQINTAHTPTTPGVTTASLSRSLPKHTLPLVNMWADVDAGAMFPDLMGGGSELFDFLNLDPKLSSGPSSSPHSPDSLDTMLDEVMGVFQGSSHEHGFGDGLGHSADDCLVCYEHKELSGLPRHSHFSRCGHGEHLCNGCATRLYRCPFCRDIKEGWETYVHATEALQNNGCSADDDDGNPSCSAPAPSAANQAFNDALNREINDFVEQHIAPDDSDGAGPAPMSWDSAAVEPPAASFQHAPPRPMGAEVTDAAKMDEDHPQSLHDQSDNSSDRAGSVLLDRKPRANDTTVSDDKDNPFAQHGVPDVEVEMMPFKEFQTLMRTHNFSAAEQAAGKRFRKRLKNRRQVMLYADKKRVSASSLKSKNTELMEMVEQLKHENTELKERNHFLEQTLEYLEQARTDAVNECSALQEQMLRLTSQMNDLGFFDQQMVNLE